LFRFSADFRLAALLRDVAPALVVVAGGDL